jgi:UDP-glucose 4-epimerase
MILVTGGTGYIGSHTCVALAQAGHDLLILDNLYNSCATVVDRLETLCGRRPQFIKGDVRDAAALDTLFARHAITAVMNFAGLKAVGESVEKPLEYYDNNVHGTLQLLAAMRRSKVKTFVFSSSATVYGDPASVPIREDFPRSATNPYDRSKLIIEDVLADLHRAEPDWRIARLRYFNPVGAHESGLISEDPMGNSGIPNNLMPFVAQVAVGQREFLNVWGNDYPTPDGTGVRDYIHVVDLAEGHVAALDYLNRQGGLLTVNLGTGRGYSVLDMVKPLNKPPANRSPTRSRPAVPVISPNAGLTPTWRINCSAGNRNEALSKCVQTHGGGSNVARPCLKPIRPITAVPPAPTFYRTFH